MIIKYIYVRPHVISGMSKLKTIAIEDFSSCVIKLMHDWFLQYSFIANISGFYKNNNFTRNGFMAHKSQNYHL